MPASNENDIATLVTAGFGELLDEASLASQLRVSRSTLQSWRYSGRDRDGSSSDG